MKFWMIDKWLDWSQKFIFKCTAPWVRVFVYVKIFVVVCQSKFISFLNFWFKIQFPQRLDFIDHFESFETMPYYVPTTKFRKVTQPAFRNRYWENWGPLSQYIGLALLFCGAVLSVSEIVRILYGPTNRGVGKWFWALQKISVGLRIQWIGSIRLFFAKNHFNQINLKANKIWIGSGSDMICIKIILDHIDLLDPLANTTKITQF